jgi:hypothetical protein
MLARLWVVPKPSLHRKLDASQLNRLPFHGYGHEQNMRRAWSRFDWTSVSIPQSKSEAAYQADSPEHIVASEQTASKAFRQVFHDSIGA